MNVDPSGYFTISNVIGGIIGLGAGSLIMPLIADHLNLKGWSRSIFIGGGIAMATALGSVLGFYTAKAFGSIYASGGYLASHLNLAIAKTIAKFTGASLKAAAGNGWTLTISNFVIRVMNSGGGRTNYFRISHITNGAITLNGAYSSDRTLTHIPITVDNVYKLIKLIWGLK